MEELFTVIRRFIPLNQTDEAVVATLFQPHRLSAADYFLRAGEVCRYVGFITEGLLRYFVLEAGVEHTYDFSPEHTFVCDYESFLTQRPSSRYIQALEPVTLWRINYPALQQLYQQMQHGQQFGRLIAEQLFVNTLQKLTSFYHADADQRYDHFQQQYPGLAERIPQYVVASYVGIKPQSLSRLRARRAGKRY